MKDKKIRIMDEKDERLSVLMQSFGFGGKQARILVFLLGAKEAISADIEQATGMRQPEVSVGVHILRKLKYVKAEKIVKPVKGRPVYNYMLTTSGSDIKKQVEKKRDEEIQKILKDFEELANLLKKFEG